MLVRPSTTNLYDQSALLDAQLHADELRALRDVDSVAGTSDVHGAEQHPVLEETKRENAGLGLGHRHRQTRVRRRLSKRHRMPV